MDSFALFPDRETIADISAQMLLEVGAVQFRPDEPFRLTSGWASPVYVDCRTLISYPRVRRTLTDFAAAVILREVGFETLDAVAGGETAGIPFAAWLADRLMLPMQYVRKKPKAFGKQAQIEGRLAPDDRILLIEDLATDGRSKIKFCQALRAAGARVNHTFVLFYYDIFPDTQALLADSDIRLHALLTWWDILRACEQSKHFGDDVLAEVKAFLEHPADWSQAHGGTSAAPSSP